MNIFKFASPVFEMGTMLSVFVALVREQLPPAVLEGRASNGDIVLGGGSVIVHLSPASARVFIIRDQRRVLVGSVAWSGAADSAPLSALLAATLRTSM